MTATTTAALDRIERACSNPDSAMRLVGFTTSDVLALVAEVRRLRARLSLRDLQSEVVAELRQLRAERDRLRDGIAAFRDGAAGDDCVVCERCAFSRLRQLRRWYRRTRFGQASQPIVGVLDLQRMLKLMESRNARDDEERTYRPVFACLGTSKLAVGFMFIEGRKKRPTVDLRPRRLRGEVAAKRRRKGR